MIEGSNSNAGKIIVSRENLPRELYRHQIDALNNLNEVSAHSKFKGLLVLPTGGGKTFTAIIWALKNAINSGKKVLWIAHRHELLNQAAYTMQTTSYSNILKDIKEYTYRIISGMHDKSVNISANDDFIIASKDSLIYGLDYLKNWISHNRNNIVLVIDEAHHSPARSYRKIIELLSTENNEWFQMLGLTATPIRTAEDEQGILGNIFSDGIIYGIDLKTLISRKILSDPIFEELNTKVDVSEDLTDKDIKNILAFDNIPKEMAEKIAKNKDRNSLIINHYIKNKEKYGQTLLFAMDIDHAITLNGLFKEKGITSEFVVSNIKDMFTLVTISNKDNEDKIKRFREGKVSVLINVNILTEGVDLPKIQSVFLTRPTISTILMTQMVGRALRGVASGGTEEAYIVSFIDNWSDKIAWVNPQFLLNVSSGDLEESKYLRKSYVANLVAISKIEEFANIMDQTVDTTELENVSFIERIPVGIYSFSILINPKGEEEYTKNCDIIVYDSFKQAYEDFINDLDIIFKEKILNEKEFLDDYELEYLCTFVKNEYFEGYYNPIDYKDEDIKDILKYYAQKVLKPVFLDFDNRKSFDLAEVAKYIYDFELGPKKQREYIDSIWNEEKSFFKVFFGNDLRYFLCQLDTELRKLTNPEQYESKNRKAPDNVLEIIDIAKLPLEKIKEINFEYWRELVNSVYDKAKDTDGYYHSANSDYKSKSKACFQIDHIMPMSKGGLSVSNNLQLLTRWENAVKSDKVEDDIEVVDDIKPSFVETKVMDNSRDFEYSVEDSSATIEKYTGAGGDVIVPEELGGYPVKNIGYDAFYGCSKLMSIVIQDGIIGIADSAFYNCQGLASVTIPDSLTSISANSFSGCKKLTRINLPNCLTRIGVEAFKDCTALQNISIPSSVTEIYDCSFEGCTNLTITKQNNLVSTGDFEYSFNNRAAKIVKYLGAGGDVIIPGKLDGYQVTSIENKAFEACMSLTSVTMPSSVTKICDSAFYECHKLINVVFSENLLSIGRWAFCGCINISNILIPNNVTLINKSAFKDCIKLKNIILSDNLKKIKDWAFSGCIGLTDVIIPNSVTNIDEYAFDKCKNLKSINIPNCVTRIEEGSFMKCEKLTSVIIHKGIDQIKSRAFSGCSELQSIIIPKSVTKIGSWAFSECTELTSVVISNDKTEIYKSSFEGCPNVKFIFSENVSDDFADFECLKGKITKYKGSGGNLIIPETIDNNLIKSIGYHAFRACPGLVSVTIPGTITVIHERAFSTCHNLKSIIIPDSVTKIDEYAFAWCSKLTQIRLPNGLETISYAMFADCVSLAEIVIPQSVSHVEEKAFYGCIKLKNVIISGSGPKFSKSSFEGCPKDLKKTKK